MEVVVVVGGEAPLGSMAEVEEEALFGTGTEAADVGEEASFGSGTEAADVGEEASFGSGTEAKGTGEQAPSDSGTEPVEEVGGEGPFTTALLE